jgi:acyl carrier protein
LKQYYQCRKRKSTKLDKLYLNSTITRDVNFFDWRKKMSDEVFNEVKELIVEILGADPEKVTPEARFREDLEADSLDIVEMVMELEDRFGTEVSDEDAQSLSTVGDAVKYISGLMDK